MVSIILSVFKGEAYIHRAIKSILAQSFQDFEILVVDEYGLDNVEKIAVAFNDDRIKYFRKSDEGPGGAVKYGLTKAQYNLIAIFEQDDYWYPEKLQKQMTLLAKKPEYALISTDWCQGNAIPEQKESVLKRLRYQDGDDVFDSLLQENFIVASSVLLKKNAVEDVGFPDISKIAQGPWDRQLWLRISHKYKATIIREILVWKYINDITLINRSNYSKLQYYGWLQATEYFKEIPDAQRVKINKNIALSAYKAGLYCIDKRDIKEYKFFIKESLRYDINFTNKNKLHKLYIYLPDKVIKILKFIIDVYRSKNRS